MIAKRGNRGLGFDRDVKYFAYRFNLLQHQGVRAVRQIVKILNMTDEMGPYGRGWSYGMVYRMLNRGAELGLCSGTRSQQDTAKARRLNASN